MRKGHSRRTSPPCDPWALRTRVDLSSSAASLPPHLLAVRRQRRSLEPPGCTCSVYSWLPESKVSPPRMQQEGTSPTFPFFGEMSPATSKPVSPAATVETGSSDSSSVQPYSPDALAHVRRCASAYCPLPPQYAQNTAAAAMWWATGLRLMTAYGW